MAGRSPPEAFQNFLEPLQRAVSCVSDAVWMRSHGSARPGGLRSVVVPRHGRFAPLFGEHRLHFMAAISYELTQTDDPDRGPWKISTREYRYHVVTDDMSEVILFHWHPEGRGGREKPHLHFGASQLTTAAVLTHKTHVPTGRVALEEVVALLISEFHVVPRRQDWNDVLTKGAQQFMRWRTWP